MDTVLHGFLQHGIVPSSQRLQKQRYSLEIEHRVFARHHFRHRAARGGCWQWEARRQYKKAHCIWPFHADGESRAVGHLATDRQAAEEGRGNIVRMTFQRTGGIQESLLGQWTGYGLIES